MEHLRTPLFYGLWLVVVGITVTALCIAAASPDGRTIGETLMLGGAMTVLCDHVCRHIDNVNRPADEAYKQGYEMGHDRGWQEGFAFAKPLSVVHSIERQTDAVDGEAVKRPVPGRVAGRSG